MTIDHPNHDNLVTAKETISNIVSYSIELTEPQKDSCSHM